MFRMSYCEDKGKDKITHVSRKDHQVLPDLDEATNKALFAKDDPKGLILPDGTINWHCPCLGNMASGPCADPFMSAFMCFHNSKSEPKGSDCLKQFTSMQDCFNKYPDLFGDHNNEATTIPSTTASSPESKVNKLATTSPESKVNTPTTSTQTSSSSQDSKIALKNVHSAAVAPAISKAPQSSNTSPKEQTHSTPVTTTAAINTNNNSHNSENLSSQENQKSASLINNPSETAIANDEHHHAGDGFNPKIKPLDVDPIKDANKTGKKYEKIVSLFW